MDGFDLSRYRGLPIVAVHRLRQEVGGAVADDVPDGPVEFHFAGGAVLFCRPGPDGDSVVPDHTAWQDPFAEPLSPENEEFVRVTGRPVRHDVSTEDPFAPLLERTVLDVVPISGSEGKLYGLLLDVSGFKLVIYTNADELGVRLLA